MDIQVARADLSRVRLEESAPGALDDGQVRMRVAAFALTANNVTYAVFGDMLEYWRFFPVVDDVTGEWGRVPTWGFGDVVESRSADAEVGERFYGYYPMSSELVIDAGRADERGLSDMAAHRAPMAAAYSRYARCATDPLYRPDREDHQMLFFPLFFTSFVIDDLLADNDSFGAEQIVVSSASSKTAIGVAYLAHARGARVVGLTSPANVAFVGQLGIYDQVQPYARVDDLDRVGSVYVDIAGNQDVLHAVHHRLDGVLTYSMTVGDTHWNHQAAAAADALPAPAPEFFFAPTQIAKRTADWGRAGLDERVAAAWWPYTDWVDGWIEFRRAAGAAAVTDVYRQVLGGHTDPRTGFICSLAGA